MALQSHQLSVFGLLLLQFLPKASGSCSTASSTFENSVLMSDQSIMDDLIRDIFEEPEEEARFFNYNRHAALNTSVAFTLPVFTFMLPGSQKIPETAIKNNNSFGVLAFAALYLLAGIGVVVYGMTQTGSAKRSTARANFEEMNHFDNPILNTVYNAIYMLPEALNIESCTKLSICEAHADPQYYGILSWPIRLLVPAKLDEGKDRSLLTEYEKAALFGQNKENDCDFEYPCLVQPLDTLIYLKDYLLSSE